MRPPELPLTPEAPGLWSNLSDLFAAAHALDHAGAMAAGQATKLPANEWYQQLHSDQKLCSISGSAALHHATIIYMQPKSLPSDRTGHQQS